MERWDTAAWGGCRDKAQESGEGSGSCSGSEPGPGSRSGGEWTIIVLVGPMVEPIGVRGGYGYDARRPYGGARTALLGQEGATSSYRLLREESSPSAGPSSGPSLGRAGSVRHPSPSPSPSPSLALALALAWGVLALTDTHSPSPKHNPNPSITLLLAPTAAGSHR